MVKKGQITSYDIEDIDSYLTENGWQISKQFAKPLNKYCKPVPWICYNAINFIERHIATINDIFEYGCGYSTLYYLLQNKNISFVEHNKKWFNFVHSKHKNLSNTLFTENKKDYINFIENGHTAKYDFISIDGAFRRECILKSINYIKEDGIIALDNSERRTYKTIKNIMHDKGFNFIEFKGIGPIRLKPKETTFFFKKLRQTSV